MVIAVIVGIVVMVVVVMVVDVMVLWWLLLFEKNYFWHGCSSNDCSIGSSAYSGSRSCGCSATNDCDSKR